MYLFVCSNHTPIVFGKAENISHQRKLLHFQQLYSFHGNLPWWNPQNSQLSIVLPLCHSIPGRLSLGFLFCFLTYILCTRTQYMGFVKRCMDKRRTCRRPNFNGPYLNFYLGCILLPHVPHSFPYT